MPTYDYVCGRCGRKFELYQSIKDEPVKKCPKCGKNGAKRQIGGGSGLLFKGSGFYVTDYRSENYKAGAKNEPGAGSSVGKVETKPAKAVTPPPKMERKPEKKAGAK